MAAVMLNMSVKADF